MVYETLGGITRVVVLPAALVAAVQYTWWYPSLMLILTLRARHIDAKRLIWVKSLKSRDRPRLKESTSERVSLSSSKLQLRAGWLWAARLAALTRARASSLRISSSKNHLSAMTFSHD